jgi:hypothetical protein
MMHFSKTLKTTALAGLFGLGFLAASPALAHRVYTRCDSDGDRCYRVVCDDDGDDCRRTSSYNGYYNNGYYNNGYRSYYNSYNSDRYNRYYNNYGYRRWVCDSDGDRCHWSYDRD